MDKKLQRTVKFVELKHKVRLSCSAPTYKMALLVLRCAALFL